MPIAMSMQGLLRDIPVCVGEGLSAQQFPDPAFSGQPCLPVVNMRRGEPGQ
jgi:hypothetical protein